MWDRMPRKNEAAAALARRKWSKMTKEERSAELGRVSRLGWLKRPRKKAAEGLDNDRAHAYLETSESQ